MKVLIADDEQHVRSTVRALLEWEGLDDGLSILEADDGESAIRIIQEESPDLVLTDIVMPQMNGIDLLQWIHEHAGGTKTIVISGHDNFSFVRSTMKLGGMDYLLKPIDSGELGEAVRRAIQDIAQRETEKDGPVSGNSLTESERDAYRDFVFAALLEEDGLPDSVLDQLAGELGIEPGDPCCVAVVALTEPDRRTDRDVNRNDPEAADARQWPGTLLAEAKRAFRSGGKGYVLRNRKSDGELYVIMWGRGISAAEELADFLRDMKEVNGRLDAGLGRSHKFPNGLARSLREARAALKKRNLLDRETNVHLFEEDVDDAAASHVSSEGLADLKRFVVAGDASAIRQYFAQWLARMKEKGTITPAGLELASMEWHVAGLDWLHESVDGNAIQEMLVSGMLTDPQKEGVDAGTIEDFTEKWSDWFSALSTVISQVMDQDKDKSLVSGIKCYIDEHYREPLSLRTIAGQFHFTREHISRKFRKETGLNLSDYLIRVRIEKAKELLLNSDLRIREIGEEVGIPDEKYFSRIFKRLTGVSPNDYRKRN